MRIEQDVKLDFKDVLIRPKRSTLGSRKEIELTRGFTFRNYQYDGHPKFQEDKHYRGIPIIASNMDGVGTMTMADTLAKQKIMTCLVKTYTVQQLVDYFDHEGADEVPIGLRADYVAMSIGITDQDHTKFRNVYEQCDRLLKYVCIAC